MPVIANLTGQRFGKLVALAAVGKSKHHRIVWQCRCECGTILNVVSSALRGGNTKSCGAVACCPRTKHGHTANGRVSPTYLSWQAMVDRCRNPNNIEYARYGGNGVRVCARWFNFANFLADMGERPAGKTLDRFPDRHGAYGPGNCRWATPQEQTINRAATRLTAAIAQEIHGRHARGESNASIARQFQISPCHVSLILSGAKWKGSKAAYLESIGVAS